MLPRTQPGAHAQASLSCPELAADDRLSAGLASDSPTRVRRRQHHLSVVRPARRLQHLTPCERIVPARAAVGETNSVIAKALFISPGTVRKHLEHIYDKLEIHNRTEATAIYTRGLSEISPTCRG